MGENLLPITHTSKLVSRQPPSYVTLSDFHSFGVPGPSQAVPRPYLTEKYLLTYLHTHPSPISYLLFYLL